MPTEKPSFNFYLKCTCLTFASVIIILNTVQLSRELNGIRKIKRVIPFHFPGLQFAGLQDFLKDTKRIGYYTDKDLKDDEMGKMFAQAQLILAPVVLDLNNLERRYIIFDCADEQHALNKIQAIGARAIKKKGGLILAERRP